MQKHLLYLVVPLFLLLLPLVACGTEESARAEVPTAAAASSSTATPEPTATPSPAPEPTAEPTPEPTEEPTPEPTPEPPPPPRPAAANPAQPPVNQPPPPPQPTVAPPPPAPAGPVSFTIVAQNLAFDRRTISVPAGATVTATLQNNDQSVPHDFGVSILGVAHTETCYGPCTRSISFTAPRGTFSFQCSLHPDMVGTFIGQ